PIYSDLARARLCGRARRLLAGRERKTIASIVGIVAAVVLLTSGSWITAAVLVGLGIPVIVIRIGQSLRRSGQLRDLSAKSWPEETIPSAMETLRAMGVADDRIRTLLA